MWKMTHLAERNPVLEHNAGKVAPSKRLVQKGTLLINLINLVIKNLRTPSLVEAVRWSVLAIH